MTEVQVITYEFRQGTSDRWTAVNPVLNIGEPGCESDTGKYKLGDGKTHWNDLAYVTDERRVNVLIQDALDVFQVESGSPGASAYQLAQQAGFSGTESEWLASLKGVPGDPASVTASAVASVVGDPEVTEVLASTFLRGMVLTQEEYDALPTKDPSILYVIKAS